MEEKNKKQDIINFVKYIFGFFFLFLAVICIFEIETRILSILFVIFSILIMPVTVKLIKRILDLQRIITKKENELKELETKIDSLSEKYDTITSLENTETLKQTIKELESKFKEKEEKLNTQLENEVNNLKNKYNEEANTLDSHYKQKLENIKNLEKLEKEKQEAINMKSVGLSSIIKEMEKLEFKKSMLEQEVEDIYSKRKLFPIEQVDSLKGLEFEDYTVNLLKNLGYVEISKTQSSGDFGIDIIALKNGIKYAIQCKLYSSTVGNKAVQEAYSGKDYYNCHLAVVITNNYFTAPAKKQAEQTGVLLWDREKLIEMIEMSEQ